jgi:hypothetical protein
VAWCLISVGSILVPHKKKHSDQLLEHCYDVDGRFNFGVGCTGVSQFKYLRTTVTIQNLIQEEIKRRFNSGTACYHSALNLLSSHLLSKKLKNLNIHDDNFACGSVWM